MIPVFDANRSKTDAVLTTASLTGTPPHIAPSSEMKRSVSCSLRVSGRRATENNARKGEVINTVIITKNMPLRAVAWIGLRIAGLSWLILSSPENASHAPENPTKNVRVRSRRTFQYRKRPQPIPGVAKAGQREADWSVVRLHQASQGWLMRSAAQCSKMGLASHSCPC